MVVENVKPILPVKAPQKWDYETDVLVMGGGGSGLAAAMAAREHGADVIVLEKADDVGGETHMANGAIAFGSKLWKETTKETWTEADLYEHVGSLAVGTAPGSVDRRLLKNNLVWAAYLSDRFSDMGIKWYVKQWSYRYPTVLVYTPISTDIADYSYEEPYEFKFGLVTRTLERWLRKQGAEFLLGTPATALIADDSGRVIGARAKTKAGKTIHIKARGVVDSTGGFSANREMLGYYHSSGFYAGCTTSPMTKMGDGIRMCQGVGAIVGNMTGIDGAEGGITCLKRGTGNKAWGQSLYDTPVQLARQPNLYVNKYGVRFQNEYQSAGGNYDMCFKQPGHVIYTIYDANLEEAVSTFNSDGCKKLVTADMAVYYNDDDIRKASEKPPYVPWYTDPAPSFSDWHDGLKRGIENGVVKVADTIEELARRLEIDPAGLTKTVDEYNDGYDRKQDNPLFGKDPGSLLPIRKAPFYGIEHGPRVLDTTGGVVVNERGQVINSSGQPIPGLYAGSLSISGVAGQAGAMGVMGAMAHAYVAAKSAAGDALS
ncbi:FAD-dependent oxidoreductase [Chloroflexota bacterium]